MYTLQEVFTPFLVCVHQHLNIGLAAETVAAIRQLLPYRFEVVDFPVCDKMNGAVLSVERLLPTADVNDRQAAHSQTNTGQHDVPLVVGTPMPQRAGHARQLPRVDRPIALTLDDSDDSTHSAKRYNGRDS